MKSLRPFTLKDNGTISKDHIKLNIAVITVGANKNRSNATGLVLCQITELICTCLESYMLLRTCYQFVALQAGMKTNCDSSFSPYICGQLLSSLQEIQMPLLLVLSPVTGFPPCTNTFRVHAGRRVKGKLRYLKFCLSNH